MFFIAVELCVMQWWIGTDRFVEALCFAPLIEEGILVCLVDKEVELEVTS